MEKYTNLIIDLLKELEEKEIENINKASIIMFDAMKEEKVVHIFATGHSHMFAEEMFYRAGGLVQINPILEPALMQHEGAVRSTQLERLTGLAKILYSGLDVKEGEPFIIVSNSGINSVPVEMAEIVREKGTNRSKFYRGQIDKYTWVNFGSSYLPSDMNAAYLYAQLEMAQEITDQRLACWNRYYERLLPLAEAGRIELPVVPEGCVHNAHMFYIKAADIEERSAFISFMKEQGIMCVFHYIPLHTAPAGLKFGRFHGEDKYTTRESERLVRLPMYYGLTLEQVDHICDKVLEFFG